MNINPTETKTPVNKKSQCDFCGCVLNTCNTASPKPESEYSYCNACTESFKLGEDHDAQYKND